jgi:hypothetical protein
MEKCLIEFLSKSISIMSFHIDSVTKIPFLFWFIFFKKFFKLQQQLSPFKFINIYIYKWM